ncbi:MAG: AMP-binding protein [Acidaminococcaceae bacterium]|nr:AMP-binding protein [Acidaminococcaceae bacterium]
MNYVTLLKKQAEEKADIPYIVLHDRQITYRQAYEDARWFVLPEWERQFPQQYKTSVLIVSAGVYHQLLAFLAVMAAGQIPVIGHYDLPEAAQHGLVEQNRIGFILAETENGWTLKQGAAEAAVAGEAAKKGPSGQAAHANEEKDDFDNGASSFVPAQAPYQNACMGVLSSGSTDAPKVMYRTYESWAGFIPEQNRRFCIDEKAVVFAEGSFSFTGNLSIWASVLYAGCTLVVSESFRCRQWLELIWTHRVSVLYLVPAKLKALTRYLDRAYPAMRMILAGSQLLGAKTAETLKEHFPNSEIILYYGASELDYITWLSYEEMLRYPDSVGRSVPGVQVWVENGLIYIDTPYHVEGLQQPCTLHDTGWFNDEGYLIFNGRESDIINKGGFKISCTKIENALCSLPDVTQAVVLPYDDAGRGQEAAAFVTGGPELTKQELRLRLRTVLMPQEMPKKLVLLREIPLNSRGKTDKAALKKLLEEKL